MPNPNYKSPPDVFAIDRAMRDLKQSKLKTVKESGGSCKSCKFFSPLKSYCVKLHKQIKPYNYCGEWKQKVEEQRNES